MGKAGNLFGFNHSVDLEKQLNNGKYFYILNHKHETMKYMVDHGCIKLDLSSLIKEENSLFWNLIFRNPTSWTLLFFFFFQICNQTGFLLFLVPFVDVLGLR